MKKYFIICSCILLALFFSFVISCSRDNKENSKNIYHTETLSETDEPDEPGFFLNDQYNDDNAKMIHSFDLFANKNPKYLSEDISGSVSGNTITLKVPLYTNKKLLIPAITYSGKSITPQCDEAANFSKGSVTYTVTAEDGTTAKYKIIIQSQQLAKTIEYIPEDNHRTDPDNDAIIGYSIPEYFKDGTMSKYTRYYSGGKDGTWFTDDDDVDVMIVYNKAGDVLESLSFNGPGPDGKYFTQDDIYNSYELHFYNDNGNEVEYVAGDSAGRDGIWLTEDDSFSALHLFEYDNNLLRREIQYSDTDIVSCYYLLNYDSDSRIEAEWKYKGAGPDGAWFTEDDDLAEETTYQYDDSGNILRETFGQDKYGNILYWYSFAYNAENKIIEKTEYTREGYDNKWFTDDDFINSREMFEYNKDGQLALSINSHSPGNDRIWYNSDDNINYYTVLDYTKSTETHTCYYWPNNRVGPDGLWFTDDDVPWYKIYIRYNVIRNIKKDQELYIASYGAGEDGKWFTADDENLKSYMRNRFDRHGNPLGTTYYNGAGNDGIWMTGDDLVDYYTVSVYK
ncbi:MAG: hypothetical protein V1874_00310 [Spirochaetota bacterium]